MINARKREAALEGLREYLDQVGVAKRKLERYVQALKRSIQLLEGQDPLAAARESMTDAYRGLGATKAVIRLLRDYPKRRFRASEVKNALLLRGFQTKSKYPDSLISSTLDRLARKNCISRGERNGTKVYWAAEFAEKETEEEAVVRIAEQGREYLGETKEQLLSLVESGGEDVLSE